MIRPRVIIPIVAISSTVAGLASLLLGLCLMISFLGCPPDRSVSAEPPPCAIELPEDVDTLSPEQIPRFLAGSFRWNGDTELQVLALDVNEVHEDGELIMVTGRGTYTTQNTTHFTFRMEVNPRTRTFRMFESDPSGANFVTEGKHSGTFTGDFERFSGQWADDFGGTGSLELVPTSASGRPIEHVPNPLIY